jgi:hypothetical protein
MMAGDRVYITCLSSSISLLFLQLIPRIFRIIFEEKFINMLFNDALCISAISLIE